MESFVRRQPNAIRDSLMQRLHVGIGHPHSLIGVLAGKKGCRALRVLVEQVRLNQRFL
jgi:hypothetical protein